jgi:hypothetical protein
MSLLFIPVLLVTAALSYPFGAVLIVRRRYQEKRLVTRLTARGRVMQEEAFQSAMAEERGTLIHHWESPKGPIRWWWTSDDIVSGAPHKFGTDPRHAGWDPIFHDFTLWCEAKYISEEKGKALLICSSSLPHFKVHHDRVIRAATVPS